MKQGIKQEDEMEIDDEEEENRRDILDVLPIDLIPLILSNFTNRQRCKIANVCKLFDSSIKLIINNSITIKWDISYNKPIKLDTINPNKPIEILALSDKYNLDSIQLIEDNYNNVIKFHMAHTKNAMNDIEAPFYAKTYNNIFYFNCTAFDGRIYMNDIIDLKWNIINLRKFNKEDKFKKYHEMGVYIETSMTKSIENPSSWNIGFILGLNIFVYHPGYNGYISHNGWGGLGAARVEGPNGWHNESMGWIPSNDKLQKFDIFINQKSHIYLKITQQNDDNECNEYIKDWQHKESLFMNKECTKLKPNIFGIRIENSNHRGRRKRIGKFGNIYINVGQRDMNTGAMSVCRI